MSSGQPMPLRAEISRCHHAPARLMFRQLHAIGDSGFRCFISLSILYILFAAAAFSSVPLEAIADAAFFAITAVAAMEAIADAMPFSLVSLMPRKDYAILIITLPFRC